MVALIINQISTPPPPPPPLVYITSSTFHVNIFIFQDILVSGRGVSVQVRTGFQGQWVESLCNGAHLSIFLVTGG